MYYMAAWQWYNQIEYFDGVIHMLVNSIKYFDVDVSFVTLNCRLRRSPGGSPKVKGEMRD